MTSNLTEIEKGEKFARFFVLFRLYLVKTGLPPAQHTKPNPWLHTHSQ